MSSLCLRNNPDCARTHACKLMRAPQIVTQIINRAR